MAVVVLNTWEDVTDAGGDSVTVTVDSAPTEPALIGIVTKDGSAETTVQPYGWEQLFSVASGTAMRTEAYKKPIPCPYDHANSSITTYDEANAFTEKDTTYDNHISSVWAADGSKLYVLMRKDYPYLYRIETHSCPTAYSLDSSTVETGTFAIPTYAYIVSGYTNDPSAMCVTDDGDTILIICLKNGTTKPFVISVITDTSGTFNDTTGTYDGRMTVDTWENGEATIASHGDHVYVAVTDTSSYVTEIWDYEFSTKGDIDTLSDTSGRVTSSTSTPYIDFDGDGTRLFVKDGQDIASLDLDTAYEFPTTAGTLSNSTDLNLASGVFSFSNDGLKIFVINQSWQFEYTLDPAAGDMVWEGASETYAATVMEIQEADYDDIVYATSTGTSTAPSSPTIGATTADTVLLLAGCGIDGGATATLNANLTSSSNQTETGGSGITHAVGYITSDGTGLPYAHTSSANDEWVGYTIGFGGIPSYDVIGSGGVTVSGDGPYYRGRIVQVSGGVETGGAADVTNLKTYIFTPTGGAELGGAATVVVDISLDYDFTPTGGVIVSGDAYTHLSPAIAITGEGGVILGGVATVMPARILPDGGVVIAGTGNVSLSLVTTTFDVFISGEVDGEEDFYFPLKSYSGTHYSEETSYLNFQLVRRSGDVDALLDRPNGEIVLLRSRIEVFRATIKSINHYTGPVSGTLTISAEYSQEETTPKTTAQVIESIDLSADGKRTFTVPGYIDFQPLDLLSYGAEDIEIDKVDIYLSAESSYFKLREK